MVHTPLSGRGPCTTEMIQKVMNWPDIFTSLSKHTLVKFRYSEKGLLRLSELYYEGVQMSLICWPSNQIFLE